MEQKLPVAHTESQEEQVAKAKAAAKASAFQNWRQHYRQQAIGPFVILCGVGAINIVILLLMPMPLRLVFDAVFGNSTAPGFLDMYVKSEILLYWLAAMMVGLFVLQRIFGLAQDYAENLHRFKLRSQAERDFYTHIMRLPQNVKKMRPDSDYVEHLHKDAGAVADVYLVTFVNITLAIGLLASMVVVLMVTSLSTTMLSLIIVGPLYASIRYFSRKRESLPAAKRDGVAKTKQFLAETIAGSNVVQAYNRGQTEEDAYFEMQLFLYKLRVNKIFLNNGSLTVDGGLYVLAVIVFIVVGGRAALNGYIGFGQLIIFMFYFYLIPKTITTIQNSLDTYKKQKVSMQNAFDFIYELPEQQDNVETPVNVGRATGQLVYQNVSVMVNSTPLLNSVNLTIEPGQKVAIIGPRSSGKSAILSLPVRLNTWANGNIYLDGREVRMFDLASLRDQFSYVEQHPTVFSDSIFGNVAFGKAQGQTNLAEATAALGAAGAYDFVKKLPHGLDTTIGEAGEAKLTTGQKQQIAIARAFMHNAPVLLLDEPLSEVEDNDQNDILGSLTELMKGRTVLMVTHHLELLQQVDVIYVIENGNLRDVNEYGGIAAYHDVLQALKPKTPIID